MTATLFLATPTVPNTVELNTAGCMIMILCNLFAMVIGRYFIQHPGQGRPLPVPKPELWGNFGIPELLATTSFGHILGTGMILGLANAGIL